ncbi:MAG: DUF1993 domain-containing protein [Sphingomicrobium sp.]
MTVTLFSFVEMYAKGLTTLQNLLQKGRSHAADKGIGEQEMLAWRLVDDMFPLWRQSQIVAIFGARWPTRAAGLGEIDEPSGEMDFDQLFALIAKSRASLAKLTAEQFDGKGSEPFSMDLGVIKPDMPIEQWVTGFATTNFYFHLSMAYAILRQRGVPLGKPDLFAGGL